MMGRRSGAVMEPQARRANKWNQGRDSWRPLRRWHLSCNNDGNCFYTEPRRNESGVKTNRVGWGTPKVQSAKRLFEVILIVVLVCLQEFRPYTGLHAPVTSVGGAADNIFNNHFSPDNHDINILLFSTAHREDAYSDAPADYTRKSQGGFGK